MHVKPVFSLIPLVLGTIVVAACSPQPERRQAAGGLMEAESRSSPHVDSSGVPPAATTRVQDWELCGLHLGESLPVTTIARKVEVATEGEPLIVYESSACGGDTKLSIEMELDRISRLDLEGRGACMPSVACVGELFGNVVSRFPSARRVATLVEGKTLALVVDETMVVRFDAMGLDDSCFDQPLASPNVCESKFLDTKVIAIGLS